MGDDNMLVAKRATNYLTDQGEFDSAPLVQTAQYTPDAAGNNGLLVRPLASTANTETQAERISQTGTSTQMADKGTAQTPAGQDQPRKRSFLEPQPNGDLRIGEDVYLRWKKPPSLVNSLIGGVMASQIPGVWKPIVAGSLLGEALDQTNFGFPWFSVEPEQPPQPQEPQQPEQSPQQPPQQTDPNEGLC